MRIVCGMALVWAGMAASVRAEDVARVEVNAQRPDQRAQEVGSRVVVRHEELIRYGDVNLVDAVKRLPGVTIGGPAGRPEIRLSGLGNGYTQLLLNGLPAPAGFSLEALAPELIERIEILRVPSAVLGAQAIAGAINIVLRQRVTRAQDEYKLGLGTERGMFAPSASLDMTREADGWSWTVPVSLARSLTGGPQQAVESGPFLRQWSVVDESRVNRLNLAPRLQWGERFNWQLGLLHSEVHDRGRNDETTLSGAASDYPHSSKRFDNHSTLLKSDWQWTQRGDDGSRDEWLAGWQGMQRPSDFLFTGSGNAAPTTHTVQARVEEYGRNLGWRHGVTLRQDHQLSVGLDGAHQTRDEFRDESMDSAGAHSRLREEFSAQTQRMAFYVQDEWQWSANTALILGWRWERRTLSSTGIDQRYTLPSPIMQWQFKTEPGQQWRLGVARSFRMPGLFHMIPRRYTVDNDNNPSNPDTQGNPALRPERAWGLNLGWERHLGGAMVSMSASTRRIQDVIVDTVSRDARGWVSMPTNRGQAQVHGLEFEARWPGDGKAPQWTLQAARNWSRVDSLPGPNARLDRQIPISAGVSVDDKLDAALSVGASLNWQDGGWSSRPEQSDYAGPRTVLDAYAVWQWRPGWRWRLSASNLLAHSTHTIVQAQGITSEAQISSARAVRIQLDYRP